MHLYKFKKVHLQTVLDMIARSDSTNRSIDTWHGNNMTAILAFNDSELIGAIPLEKRSFSLGKGKFIDILWISGAHVEPDYRSKGIGTAMDQKIKDYYSSEFKAVFAYRGDETSRAYRWYKKLEYCEMLPILSFKKEVRRPEITIQYELWDNEEMVRQWESKLFNCFNRYKDFYGGFPQRHRQFWSDKFKTHYYKEFYDYSILALTDNNEILCYAFLGQTSMKDNIPRIDILEISMPEDFIIKDSLFNAIMDFAYRHGLTEVRIQLSVQDPHLKWVKKLGFINRWRTNIIGKLFNPIKYFEDIMSEKIDLMRDYQFIIKTPKLGEHTVGTGKSSIKLFAHDSLFNEILLCRCNITNAIEEGRLVIVDGNENNTNILVKNFPLNKWKYFQIDYI
jgi:GNAT superfamily N-acetyltransferase